jgi:hypothetical protein
VKADLATDFLSLRKDARQEENLVERKKLQVRWDVVNVANLQRFVAVDGSRTGIGVARDPRLESSDELVQLHRNPGSPRVMQVGARYSF